MLAIFTIAFWCSVALYYYELNIVASAVMIALAIFLYVIEYRKERHLINVRGLFSLGFIGGFGISLLKLSKLSDKYSMLTILSIFIAYFSIYLGGYFASKNENKDLVGRVYIIDDDKKTKICNQDRLVLIMMGITFLSFLVEAIILKFIPLFTIDTPHAYSTFHVFLLHYITTFYVFIPSLSVCNYYFKKSSFSLKLIALSFLYVIIMSVLLVSRAQLIMGFIIAFFSFFILNVKNIKKYVKNKKILIYITMLIILFAILYMIITINRAHNVEYLNGIFEMKNEKMPIFITQPYMYVAHNFENLNYMINNTFRWTFGRRTLYPLFTLLLIKKFFPIVVDSPYYIIKPELSTVTLIYDFYYDFGLSGVMFFCFLLGYFGKKLENRVYMRIEKKIFYKNNYIVILLSLFCYTMFFSFFQAYYSLTDIWVYFILLSLLSVFFISEKR